MTFHWLSTPDSLYNFYDVKWECYTLPLGKLLQRRSEEEINQWPKRLGEENSQVPHIFVETPSTAILLAVLTQPARSFYNQRFMTIKAAAN